MPYSAAALVTSGSLAAPSSIEYSVCTWRWANESAVLTGGRAPQWSCVPAVGFRRATGGEDRLDGTAGGDCDPRTVEVYSGVPTGCVSAQRTDLSQPCRQAPYAGSREPPGSAVAGTSR